jgi:hypothetical protein
VRRRRGGAWIGAAVLRAASAGPVASVGLAEVVRLHADIAGCLRCLLGLSQRTRRRSTSQLGVRLTYRHDDRTALAEVDPGPSVCTVVVSEGGLEPFPHGMRLARELLLAS